MQTLTVPKTLALLEHVAVTHRKPVFTWGEPGVGKSAIAKQLAEKIGAHLVDIRLSQYDSVDLRGIPSPDPVTNLTTWYPPSTLPFVGNPLFVEYADRPIILFLDEMNSASASVQAVAYQLVLDRRIGEHQLMPNVILIAAGNRETDKGVTTRMPTPLANRFTHVEVGVDVDAWCLWAQSVGLPAVGIAFMQFRKPLLSTFDPSKTDKAFATPRSWETALRFYDDPTMPFDVQAAAIDGTVGPGPAAEFMGFVKVWSQMPDLNRIIKDPKGVPVSDDPSMRYAVTVALSAKAKADTLAAIHTYLDRFQADEFIVLLWQLAVKRDASLMQTPEFIAMAHKLKAVFA